MKLKDLFKEMKKSITGHEWTQKEVNGFLNDAMEATYKYCPIPKCGHKSKNWIGTRIHLAKKHGLTKDKIVKETAKKLTTKRR